MSTIERVEAPATMPVVLDPRVERGAALLDGLRPGWADEIDLDTFALQRCKHCIGGQLGFEWAAEHIPDWSANGLYVPWDDGDDTAQHRTYNALEQDWRLAILSRRSV